MIVIILFSYGSGKIIMIIKMVTKARADPKDNRDKDPYTFTDLEEITINDERTIYKTNILNNIRSERIFLCRQNRHNYPEA